MANKTFDLYLIQDPKAVKSTWSHHLTEEEISTNRGYNKDLLRAFHGSVPVRDIKDFIHRMLYEWGIRGGRSKIGNLYIGSHGDGNIHGGGSFYASSAESVG